MQEELVHISNKPSEQVLELLKENCLGTPGESMVYRQSGVRDKVLSLSNAYFANLSIRDCLYGTICLCKIDVMVKSQNSDMFQKDTPIHVSGYDVL